jgi:hypothetical protein
LGLNQKEGSMSKNKFPICHKLLCLVALLFLFACAQKEDELVDATIYPPDMVDQSWIDGQPCLPPCWQGLEPGISSREEAVDTVKNLSFISSERQPRKYENADGFFCKIPDNDHCVSMIFENGMLDFLQLYINYRLTIEQMIELIGTPNGFAFSEPHTGSSRVCEVKVLWSNRQIEAWIKYKSHQGCDVFIHYEGEFPRNVQVTYIFYEVPGTVEKYIQGILETDPNAGTGIYYFSWVGFRE